MAGQARRRRNATPASKPCTCPSGQFLFFCKDSQPSTSAAAPPTSYAGNANKAADTVVQANTQMADASKDADFKSFRPSLISVEVLGFGDEEDECNSGNPITADACAQAQAAEGRKLKPAEGNL